MAANFCAKIFPLLFALAAIASVHCQTALNDFIDPDFAIESAKNAAIQSKPDDLSLVKGESGTVTFYFNGKLTERVRLFLNTTNNLRLDPVEVELDPANASVTVTVYGVSVTSRTFIEVGACELVDSENKTCPFKINDSFVRVKVVHSSVISILVIVTGWIYFFAWSISFYPQIWLNWRRSSVEGLNFDFLILNIIGFSCYTIYNWMMYFDDSVQDLYLDKNPRSLIPVLLNDVVFATHALLACLITGLQCFFYERGNQRISYICRGWSVILCAFAVISLIITVCDVVSWLTFINNLSYVKMAVTMSKYFPQAILNFRRKSTTGWSIGNVLLDFTGGSMDICQMILQASNTEDWTGFYGNPVKFGLGLVSMVFDVVFMIQHYCLYRHSDEQANYDVINTSENSGNSTTEPTGNETP